MGLYVLMFSVRINALIDVTYMLCVTFDAPYVVKLNVISDTA